MGRPQRIPAGVYGITGPEHCSDTVSTVRAWLAAGIRTVQLRWKAATPKDYFGLARTLQGLCARKGGLFVVNDRVDVAKVLGTAVHIGPDDLPLEAVRQILGPRAIIGVSTNTPAEARRMERLGASYVGFGPLYPTASKGNLRARRSLSELARTVRGVSIPVIGIGGISESSIADVLAAGARAAAVIGALNGKNPELKARKLIEAIRAHPLP
ncbi:MAG: thiamine phosphate synthase [Deltaproteobacteria bacterium]|nr:thiamine phosphate synthase [Deltaproteobacteria bacterium]